MSTEISVQQKIFNHLVKQALHSQPDKAFDRLKSHDLSGLFDDKTNRNKIKRLYKRHQAPFVDLHLFNLEDSPNVVNQWMNVDDNGESWTYFYLISATCESDVINLFEAEEAKGTSYISLDSIDINSPYDCTGEVFSRGMYIRKVGQDRYLADKTFAIDC